jgi:hypothetical protein
MGEIQEIIERVDFRWDHGFIDPNEYVEKRAQLERELDALRPIDYDELIEAADLLEHFQDYWDQCDTVDDPLDARMQLLQKIVERVFVHDGNVLAIVLYGDFGVVLGENETASVEIADAIEKEMATNGVSITRSRCGSDGHRTLISHHDFLTCVCEYCITIFTLYNFRRPVVVTFDRQTGVGTVITVPRSVVIR